ncbi:MAG: RecX family transcriptional regulator [Bacteroidia bacterium]|nr:RecX family transcriptional regulator [Bacteroidia bacterium]
MKSTKDDKNKSSASIFLKAANFCAYQERSHKEVLQRLSEWGIMGLNAGEIITQLIEHNYLNEERFATAFAGGKFRTKHWGKNKIKAELKLHDISDYCIQKALNEIEPTDYIHTLQNELDKKFSQTKENNILSKRAKVARYLVGKGFEPEIIWQLLKEKH